MTIDGEGYGGLGRRLRLGMVGGGGTSLIGPAHRMAARLDDRYELVAGAFSSDPGRGHESAVRLGIDASRAYADFAAMAEGEAGREDGIEVVAIVTPNHLHHGPATAFLERGVHVVCDKPLASNLEDAVDLVRTVQRTGLVFALTHAYSAYPLVRHARARVAAGDLGEIRVVQVEYAQQSHAALDESAGPSPAAWRRDPARSGAGGCIADIGTHAYHLADFVSGLTAAELCADLTTFVPGGRLDDNNNILLRYADGARGMLWASKVASGCANALKLRLFGTKAGLEWNQERPGELTIQPIGGEPRAIRAGSPDLGPEADRASRLKPGHPEGLIEAFANIYTEVADAVIAHIEGRQPGAVDFPTAEDGARGMKFVEAALESSRAGGVWVDARLTL